MAKIKVSKKEFIDIYKKSTEDLILVAFTDIFMKVHIDEINKWTITDVRSLISEWVENNIGKTDPDDPSLRLFDIEGIDTPKDEET
jgi:hypothetical protein